MTFRLRPQAEADLEDIALISQKIMARLHGNRSRTCMVSANNSVRCLPWELPNPLSGLD